MRATGRARRSRPASISTVSRWARGPCHAGSRWFHRGIAPIRIDGPSSSPAPQVLELGGGRCERGILFERCVERPHGACCVTSREEVVPDGVVGAGKIGSAFHEVVTVAPRPPPILPLDGCGTCGLERLEILLEETQDDARVVTGERLRVSAEMQQSVGAEQVALAQTEIDA